MEPAIRDPQAFFDSQVSQQVQERLLRLILAAYLQARRDIRDDYQPQVAHDVFPHILRARVDSFLYSIGSRFGFSDVEARYEPNKQSNSFHTVMKVGKVVLTSSAVEGPGVVPRNAEFRNEIADAQSRFIVDSGCNAFVIDDMPTPDDAVLYGLIIHGPEAYGVKTPLRYIPGFVRVAFPNRSCSAYLDCLDLKARFPQLFAELDKVEEVQDEAVPEPRSLPVFEPRRSKLDYIGLDREGGVERL